jgi:hypothetical protein
VGGAVVQAAFLAAVPWSVQAVPAREAEAARTIVPQHRRNTINKKAGPSGPAFFVFPPGEYLPPTSASLLVFPRPLLFVSRAQK